MAAAVCGSTDGTEAQATMPGMVIAMEHELPPVACQALEAMRATQATVLRELERLGVLAPGARGALARQNAAAEAADVVTVELERTRREVSEHVASELERRLVIALSLGI